MLCRFEMRRTSIVHIEVQKMCVAFQNDTTFGYSNKAEHRQCVNGNSMRRIDRITEFCVALKCESFLIRFALRILQKLHLF